MENKNHNDVNLLGVDELRLRLSAVCSLMRNCGMTQGLVSSNSNIYYLSGRIFRGYIFIDSGREEAIYLVRRPSHLKGNDCEHIFKPAEIPSRLHARGISVCPQLGFELDSFPWSSAERMAQALGTNVTGKLNLSSILRQARAVKTPAEQELLRQSGLRQTEVYSHIPALYRPGMSDIEFQIEIERESRLHGCLGIFRVAGGEMEIFMGNVLTGENADSPSPYDFAMGGAGLDPSLPVGADGTLIRPDFPVMVDVNGNYTGYMTDMTRCYIYGNTPDDVTKANALSAEICHALAQMMIPGTPASALYERAAAMAAEAGMADVFMGHRSQAGFVGHGVGIEINELPVIAPRSKDILQAGNVIALEPKFVLSHYGAVGVENTYIVTEHGGVQITTAPEEIQKLTD